MNRTVLFIGGIAAVAAVLRLFTRNIFEPMGVSTFVGSLLVSVTVVLLIGMGLIFFRVGLQSEGRFVRAAGWFVLLALWCELLVIRRSSSNRTPSPAYAIGHAKGFWFRTPFLVGVGGIIYSVAKRKRV